MSLGIVQTRVSPPMLLAERFLPGTGWLAVGALAAYAAWLTDRMIDPRRQPRWRRRIWLAFSAVFFGQLLLGLLGVERMLMTGELHLPVPALIAAGPLYRGQGFFMPVLFGVTVLLVGPAWCSHLCYIGAWDHEAACRQRRPRPLPRWTRWARVVVVVLVLGVALVFRVLGVSSVVAGWSAGVFGLVGVGLMLAWSRRVGAMAHCVVYCPIGWIADLLGRLSPFRLRIASECDACGVCSRVCRFDALTPADLERRQPALSCTLCGDCVRTCRGGWIGYRFLGLSHEAARRLFLVLAVSLHAVFVGVARL